MKLSSVIKILLSLLMLGLVLRSIDFSELTQILSSIPLKVFIIVLFTYGIGQMLSSVKWWVIARGSGINVPYTRVLRAYFFGMFCNCFGVGVVGGDLARGILLGLGQPIKTKAITTVLADRLQGLCVLSLIGSISVMIFGLHGMNEWLVLALSALGPATVAGWFIGPFLVKKIIKPTNKFFVKLLEIADCFPRSPKTLIIAGSISAVFHLLQIGVHSIIIDSLGASIAWSQLLTIIPFVNICSTLPISWNGLGVRENAYRFFLTPAILSNEQVIALGAIWIGAMTIVAVVGGALSMIGNDPISEAIRNKKFMRNSDG